MVTKVQIKSEKFTPFGGIFFVINLFKHRVMPHVDAFLGLHSSLVGYQYSEALLAMMCNFFSGGDRTEDINVLKSKLRRHSPLPPRGAAAAQAGRNPAIIRNFYEQTLRNQKLRAFGIRAKTRMKAFINRVVTVVAKWTRGGRRDILTLYTPDKEYVALYADYG